MQIQAAVTEYKGAEFALVPLQLEAPRDNEVLVRMISSGVCQTDLHARDQLDPVPLPAVLGHEGAGVVETVGRGVAMIEPGDHVVLTFGSCGSCGMCERGRPSYCGHFYAHNFSGARPDGTTPLSRAGHAVQGAFFGQSSFATYAVVPERNVVKVDEAAPLQLLGPLGCGIQTGAGAVLNALRPEVGTSLAVFGAGSVGLSAVMAAVVAGCTTIAVVDLNENRLKLARELGATHTLNAPQGGTVEGLRDLAAGPGLDFALDTTGIPAVFRSAVDALAVGGVCGLIGGSPPGTEVSLDMESLLFGRTVRGIVEGDSIPRSFIPKLVQLHREGRFPFDKLIKTYPFADINQAVEDSESGTTVKPVLTFA
ncbi:NAD(P)-dependent alcohol dehydrogenase [Streptomyces sp. NPDC046862]|uniref:NAD(P)-dependent alcohol dehydrogenase n=1 Tax=Streptomyces sp. NPDC046862 TaxID=3154603 RepID=UPI0034523850